MQTTQQPKALADTEPTGQQRADSGVLGVTAPLDAGFTYASSLGIAESIRNGGWKSLYPALGILGTLGVQFAIGFGYSKLPTTDSFGGTIHLGSCIFAASSLITGVLDALFITTQAKHIRDEIAGEEAYDDKETIKQLSVIAGTQASMLAAKTAGYALGLPADTDPNAFISTRLHQSTCQALTRA